jgi:hypothetical protein
MDDSTDNVAAWPDGFSGVASRRPQTLTLNGTSTISPTLLNEARFGMNINKTTSLPAWFVNDENYASQARSFLGDGGTRNGVPYSVAVDPSFFGSNGYMAAGTGQVTNLSYNNPSYTFADTLSWTRGVPFVQIRRRRSNADFRMGMLLKPTPSPPTAILGARRRQVRLAAPPRRKQCEAPLNI